jgi:hypothetical protein
MKTFLKQFIARVEDPQKPVVRVVVFGAAGGALAVLSALALGELTESWKFLLFPYIALGSGAAFVSVFVLLGIKTEDVWRCCGVALLAGFFWRPVFDAGKEYLLSQPERAAKADAAENTRKLEDVNMKLDSSPTNIALLKQAGDLAEIITRDTAAIRPSAVRSRAQSTVTRTLDLLGDQAGKGQSSALVAVADVAETAATTGNHAVADKAWTKIALIPATTNALFEAKRTNVMKYHQIKPQLLFR